VQQARSLAPVVRAFPDEQFQLGFLGSLGPFASAPIPVAFFDSGLTCRLANDAFARLAGNSPDHLIGRAVTT
jgi:PAS domain-containing protein